MMKRTLRGLSLIAIYLITLSVVSLGVFAACPSGFYSLHDACLDRSSAESYCQTFSGPHYSLKASSDGSASCACQSPYTILSDGRCEMPGTPPLAPTQPSKPSPVPASAPTPAAPFSQPAPAVEATPVAPVVVSSSPSPEVADSEVVPTPESENLGVGLLILTLIAILAIAYIIHKRTTGTDVLSNLMPASESSEKSPESTGKNRKSSSKKRR